jgi:hypothetical protein
MSGEERVYKGHFVGIRKSDKVNEPTVVVINYYDTVRSGVLETFTLVVPENARIKRIQTTGISEIIKVEYDNNTKYYYHQFGDPYDPAILRPARDEEVDEAERLLRLREIAEEARDVC